MIKRNYKVKRTRDGAKLVVTVRIAQLLCRSERYTPVGPTDEERTPAMFFNAP